MVMRVKVGTFAGGVLNPQEITHEKNLAGCERETQNFLRTAADLGERLGLLLLRLPPSSTVEGMGILEDFLKGLPPGFRYAVGVRHRNWLGSDLPEMLGERGAALALIDYPRMPRVREATADFTYVRWLRDRREFQAGHTHLARERDEDLRWWPDVLGGFLEEAKTVFAYANNHYQNRSPSTHARFLEIRRGER